MSELVKSWVAELLTKNIPFCLYRFPGKKEWHLALSEEREEITHAKRILIAPFLASRKEDYLYFRSVEESDLTSARLEGIQNAVAGEKIADSLPKETKREEYFEEIRAYLAEIKAGKLKKAILSRAFLENRPVDFDPVLLLEDLAEEKPEAFVYLFQHPGAGLWIGATPELLLQKKGNSVKTMALAATRPVRQHNSDDWGEKERMEQQLVCEHVEEVFEELDYRIISKEGPKDSISGNVVHLRTDYVFGGQKKTVEKLTEKLHPTPAIGGLPVKEALACIREHEHYDRKYYGGIIGEIKSDGDAGLFVNLRCMQIGSEKIAVYVGSGITADSVPEKEWEETVLKGELPVKLIRHQNLASTYGIIR